MWAWLIFFIVGYVDAVGKQVAICLVGQVRGFKYEEVRQQFNKNLVGPFEKAGYDVDIGYVLEGDHWTPNLAVSFLPRHDIMSYPDDGTSLRRYRQKLRQCALGLLHKTNYTYVVLARVDLIYLSPLDISQLRPGVVHTRVRSTKDVNSNYPSPIGPECRVANLRPILTSTTSAHTRGLAWLPPPSMENYTWGPSPDQICHVLPDDQFMILDHKSKALEVLAMTKDTLPASTCYCDHQWEESRLLLVWRDAKVALRLIDVDCRTVYPGCFEAPKEKRWDCMNQNREPCFYPSCVPGAYFNSRFH